MKKKVLFISSTGGHFSELLQLKPLFKKYDSYIITEKDKTNLIIPEKDKAILSHMDKVTIDNDPFSGINAESMEIFRATLDLPKDE